MEYKVVISGKNFGEHPLPGWNEALSATGRHYHQGGRMKRDYMMVIVNAIRRQLPKGLHIEKPIKIIYDYYDSNAKRDPGNLLYCDKVFEDALQICGIIDNDGQKNIHGICLKRVHVDKSNPRIEITMIEVEDNAPRTSNFDR